MPSDKAPIKQPRGWLADNTSQSNDIARPQAIIHSQPVRSPTIPPPGLRAQADQGFARFLKKHSSPTHQRVTAGGRIVPYQPCSSPTEHNNGPFDSDIGHAQTAAPSDTAGKDSPSLTKGLRISMQPRDRIDICNDISVPKLGTSFGAVQPCDFANGKDIRSVSHSAHDLPSNESAIHIAGYGQTPVVTPGTIGGNGTSAEFGFPSQFQATDFWRQPSTVSSEQASAGDTLGPCQNQNVLTHQVISAKKSLSYWSQCYDELDRQLKALDRQRAMTSLNAAMVDQRKAIVQQRSDTKDIIAKLDAFLGMSQQASSLFVQSGFNVNAPTYIPVQQSSSPVPTQSRNVSKFESYNGDRAQIQRPGARRPIPIVAPQDKMTGSTRHSGECVPKFNQTDEWGVKIGIAPPDLHRQQNRMTKKMDTTTTPRCSPLKENFGPSARRPFKSFSENDAYYSSSDESDVNQTVEDDTRTSQTPEEIERDFEKQLDALRQPKGTVTRVTLHNGTPMSIEGQSLQQPLYTAMSEFEKTYWSKRPARLASNRVENDVNDNRSDYKMSEVSTPVDSSNSKHDRTDNAYINHDSVFLKEMSANASRNSHQHGSRSSSCVSDFANLNLREKALQRCGFETFLSDTSAPLQNSGNYDHLGSEMINKGYTSISIQNIHAAAQLPYMDSTHEVGKGARMLLDVAAKTKSPRLLQRAGASGNSWFGPFRRGIAENPVTRNQEAYPQL